MITLEQVDQVRERSNVSYQKAKEVLEETNGDVLEAIVLLESGKSGKSKAKENASDFGNEVIKTLKDFLKSGNVNRILVEKDEDVLMNIPVTVGAIGAIFLTSAMTVGLIAALATGCVIKIHKEDGEVINVNDKASDMMKKTKDKANDFIDGMNKPCEQQPFEEDDFTEKEFSAEEFEKGPEDVVEEVEIVEEPTPVEEVVEETFGEEE